MRAAPSRHESPRHSWNTGANVYRTARMSIFPRPSRLSSRQVGGFRRERQGKRCEAFAASSGRRDCGHSIRYLDPVAR